LLPAKRLKTERRKNSDGTWRIYNLWQTPDGGTFREPVIDTDDDKLRKLNRAERLRSIPPTDPDYKELYGRRNDAEAQDRMLDDSLRLGRLTPWALSATCWTGSATVSSSTPSPAAAPASLGHRSRDHRRPNQEVQAVDLAAHPTPTTLGWPAVAPR
jgi:hypothetical protein